jgi:hypothetical protein
MTWSTPTPKQKWKPKAKGWERDASHNSPMVLFIPKAKRLECTYGLKGKLQQIKGSLVRLPLRHTRCHWTDHLLPHFNVTSAMMPPTPPVITPPPVLREKLENPSLTCFMTKQSARCWRVPSHRLHPLIGFEAQTDKPPPTWFWGPNQETITVILRPKSQNRRPWFWGLVIAIIWLDQKVGRKQDGLKR